MHVAEFTAGVPQLDIHTLAEDWMLSQSAEGHWQLLARDLGLVPSQWIDRAGDRMYGAVMWAETRFDLDDPIREDEEVRAETVLSAIRKPHSMSHTRYRVDGKVKAEARLLISFVKREYKGSNRKFSKVRDMWQAEDVAGDVIDDLLDRHHEMKAHPAVADVAMEYEVNRIQDFNLADLMYFKNFVRIAKAAEWRKRRGAPHRLNEWRECFYYGNADDGQVITVHINEAGDDVQTEHYNGDRRIFLSLSRAVPVEIVIQ